MRFAVFTHVQHHEREGNFYAYAPYVREMNLWLKHVEEVEIIAPRLTIGEKTLEGLPYHHSKLNFTAIPSFNLLKITSTLKAAFKIPTIFFKILGAMQRADHLHLRCPGNIGLIACVGQIFFPGKPKTAKYAGNWDPEAKQPWTYKVQRWILNNSILTRNMQVLVYGGWPGQSKNVKLFFTASFSEREIHLVKEKKFEEPYIFLFVGNLVVGKRPLEAIKLIEEIKQRYRKGRDREDRIIFLIFGEGPERYKLENYVLEEKLEEKVIFKGNRSLEELKEAYQLAHFVVLPSKSEGWPKALAEGMFFGCIPIASKVSCIPWMLGQERRGVLLEEFGKQPTAHAKQINKNDPGLNNLKKITTLLSDPQLMAKKSEEAKIWSQNYTTEKLEAAIRDILNNKK